MVGPAIFSALISAVDDGKLSVEHIVDHALRGLAGFEVEAPFVQLKIALAQMNGLLQSSRIETAIVVRVHAIGRAHHHDFCPFLPSVHHMQHIRGLGLEPANIRCATVARNHRKTRRLISKEANLVTTQLQGLGVRTQWEVVQDRVVLGDGHVMWQTGAIHGDINQVTQMALGIDHTVAHVRRLGVVIEEQKLAGMLIGAGMSGQAVDAAICIHAAQGVQRFRIHGIRQPGAIPHCHQSARMKLHVGVGSVLQRLLGRISTGRFLEAAPQ